MTTPELEKHNESIVILMSKASSAKENLIRELREAHELLVTQIYRLREKSLAMLNKVEEMSNPNLNTQIEDIDSLIARIETFSTASTEVIEKGVSAIFLWKIIVNSWHPLFLWSAVNGMQHTDKNYGLAAPIIRSETVCL